MEESMTVRPRYYYNLIGNICNEKEEFGTRLMHKEDLNEQYMDNTQKGSDSLLDLLNQYDEENEQLKQLLNEAEDIILCQCTPHYQREWENIKKSIKGDVE